MKTLFTITLLFCISFCFGQSPIVKYKNVPIGYPVKVIDSTSFKSAQNLKFLSFTEEEKIAFQEHENDVKQQEQFNHDAQIRNNEWFKSLQRKVTAAKINPERISNKGDSLQITSNGIQLKLKPEKK